MMSGRALLSRLAPLFACIGLLGIWQVASLILNTDSFPSALDAIRAIPAILGDKEALINILASLRRMAVGFSVAVAVSIPLGLLMGRSRAVASFFNPLLMVIHPVPQAALVPTATSKCAGCSARNRSASLLFSSMLTARTSRPVLPSALSKSFIKGNDKAQGAHHDAQKSRITTSPRISEIREVRPATWKAKSLALRPAILDSPCRYDGTAPRLLSPSAVSWRKTHQVPRPLPGPIRVARESASPTHELRWSGSASAPVGPRRAHPSD